MTIALSSLRRSRIALADLPPGSVIFDQRRARTAWYEGQFVTAAHFNRDQSYLLVRQADLGQAVGKGVVEGLEVAVAADSVTALTVAPGLGLAGGGEAILVHRPVQLDLADIPTQRSISRRAGLLESLSAPLETRTGLFVLAATPVEYTSNPVGAYPTSIEEERRLEDSLITEAVLFLLVPFPVPGDAPLPETWQAHAARRIFVEGAEPDLPAASLPLAMVAVEGNQVRWVDGPLVRREAGAARADVEGLGLVDEARQIAHYRQYDARITALVAAEPNRAFAAFEEFQALPPMGRMPAACIAPRTPAIGVDPVLSQTWLPAQMPVELVALPEDEIDALLAESLTLPPIDLQADAEALANTPVSVIVPVPRETWNTTPAEVQEATLTLEPPAPLGGAPSSPIALLRTLMAGGEPSMPRPSLFDPQWQALLAGRSMLWYLRRRQVQRSDTLVGALSPYVAAGLRPDGSGEVAGDDTGPGPIIDRPPQDTALIGDLIEAIERITRERIAPFGLDVVFPRVQTDDPRLLLQLNTLLNRALTAGGPLLANGMLAELRALRGRLDERRLQAIIERYTIRALGAANALGGATRPLDPVLYNAPYLVRLTAAPGEAIRSDLQERAAFIAEVSQLGRDGAQALAQTLPATFPPTDAKKPETPGRLMTMVGDARFALEFVPTQADDAETVKRRDQLAETALVPELDQAIQRAAPRQAVALVTELRALFEEVGNDPSALAERLRRLI